MVAEQSELLQTAHVSSDLLRPVFDGELPPRRLTSASRRCRYVFPPVWTKALSAADIGAVLRLTRTGALPRPQEG